MYYVFFSRWQKNFNRENGRGAIFAKLEDGRIVEYTEMCLEERPSENIDDYVLLGKGDFDHIIGIKQKNTAEIEPEVSIPFKIHPSLPPERFRLKSPKNIFKKRPHGYY